VIERRSAAPGTPGDALDAGRIAPRLAALGAPRGDVDPRAQPFMLAVLQDRPFSRPGWLFEIKYDGVRVFASRRGADVELRGRSGQVVTARYPEITAALSALPASRFLVDGEIVALDEEGRSSFQRLQARMGLSAPRDVERAMSEVPVTAIFFDCLALEGHDLRRLPLSERKACLQLVVPLLGAVRYGDHVEERGEAFFAAASERRLEGIVAKKAAGAYTGERSRDWIKIKCHLRQEFVIGGYTDPQGSRGYFGALHLGVYENGRLGYVSKVGTGFDEAALKRLWTALEPLARSTSPFSSRSPMGRGHHWVEPRLVCEVRFSDWTRDGGIRHPAFEGLRADKRAEECRREPTSPAEGALRGSPPASKDLHGNEVSQPEDSRRKRASRSVRPEGLRAGARARQHRERDDVAARMDSAAPEVVQRTVTVTNAQKIFWPAEGYTKGDLIDYYRRIAPALLPYLRDRPLVLTRYPDGIGGKSFFQHDAPAFAPSWIRTARIYSSESRRDIEYFVVDGADALAYVANLGAIPLHVWASRLGSVDRPDWLVLDLDPKGAPFADVVRVAQALRQILGRLELPSHVKTSGATGLHVLVPLGARYSYEEARSFGRLLALLGVEALPEISTVARPIRSRGGKVYIDFGQNGQGLTVVAPYSVRPLPGAPVSCPLRWNEVNAELDPSRFTIETVPDRVRRVADPLLPVLSAAVDMTAAIERIEKRLR